MSGGDWKAMFKAVQDNDLALLRYYIKIGVDLNYQHPEYMALALSESIRYNHLEIAKELLAHGAQANIVEMESGKTPLSLAKLRLNQKAVALLEQYA